MDRQNGINYFSGVHVGPVLFEETKAPDCWTQRKLRTLSNEVRKLYPSLFEHPNDTLVDLGCGAGIAMKIFYDQLHFPNLIGVDGSKDMLAFVSNLFSVQGDYGNIRASVSTLLADLERDTLAIDTASAAVINCTATTHFMSDLTLMFNEAHRILRPSGLFTFDVETHSSSDNNSMMELFKSDYGTVKCYTHCHSMIEKLIADTGFTISHQSEIGNIIKDNITKDRNYILIKE